MKRQAQSDITFHITMGITNQGRSQAIHCQKLSGQLHIHIILNKKIVHLPKTMSQLPIRKPVYTWTQSWNTLSNKQPLLQFNELNLCLHYSITFYNPDLPTTLSLSEPKAQCPMPWIFKGYQQTRQLSCSLQCISLDMRYFMG